MGYINYNKMSDFLIIIFIIFSIVNISLQGTKKEVKDLFPDYKGEIYSGYLDTLIKGNQLFYVYCPSQTNPSSDPVLLWLNGGPGCSSLFGMLAEIGPVTTDHFTGEFKLNQYSWNTQLNILIIEQPAGVGFSKTEDIMQYWNDTENAKNLLAGIKDFLATFPDLKDREFYVSGESYAGIFIPHLAAKIIEDTTSDKLNLKGILIGNALTDLQVDYDRSVVEFGFWRGLISIETYDKYQNHCPHMPDELRPDTDHDGKYQNFSVFVTHECNQARKQIVDELDGNDLYGIYKKCSPRNLTPNDVLYYNSKHTVRYTFVKGIKKLLNNNNNNTLQEIEQPIWPNMCKDDLTIDTFLNLNSTKEKLVFMINQKFGLNVQGSIMNGVIQSIYIILLY